MELIITRGGFQVVPIPPAAEGADPNARAGYLLVVTDEATGIIVRVSMEHHNAAQLGQVLVTDTEAHPAWTPPPEVQTFGVIPGGLDNGGEAS